MTTQLLPSVATNEALEHIEIVELATATTFAMICGTEPTSFLADSPRVPYEGVVGIISVVGDVAWSIMVCLPRQTAEAVAMIFTGMEVGFDSPDMGGVVAELANVIAGDIVARLDAEGLRAEMSLPMVARGSDIELLDQAKLPAARYSFSLPEGGFDVKLTVGKGR